MVVLLMKKLATAIAMMVADYAYLPENGISPYTTRQQACKRSGGASRLPEWRCAAIAGYPYKKSTLDKY